MLTSYLWLLIPESVYIGDLKKMHMKWEKKNRIQVYPLMKHESESKTQASKINLVAKFNYMYILEWLFPVVAVSVILFFIPSYL